MREQVLRLPLAPSARQWHGVPAVGRSVGIASGLVAAIGLACALSMAWGAPAPFVAFGVTCVCLLYLGIADPATAVCLFLLLSPLSFYVRKAAPTNIVLAGACAIWMTCLVAGWAWSILLGKSRVPKGLDVVALSVFVVDVLFMTLLSETTTDAFLGVRSLLVPAAIFYVVRGVVTKTPAVGGRILVGVVLATLMMAVLSCIWYHGYLDAGALFTSKGYILGGGGRTVFGHFFERLDSLIGGGASNIGIYLGAGVIICTAILGGKQTPLSRRAIALTLIFVIGYGSLLSLSRSVVALVVISLTILVFTTSINRGFKIAYVALLPCVIVGFVFGTALRDKSGLTMLETAREYSVVWTRAMPSGAEMIVGNGIRAAGGSLIGGPKGEIFVDGGWPAIWGMLGLPGILSMLAFAGLLSVACFRLARSRVLDAKLRATAVTAGAVALGLLVASGHTAVIIRPATEYVFYSLAAITLAIHQSARDEGLLDRTRAG